MVLMLLMMFFMLVVCVLLCVFPLLSPYNRRGRSSNDDIITLNVMIKLDGGHDGGGGGIRCQNMLLYQHYRRPAIIKHPTIYLTHVNANTYVDEIQYSLC